MRRGLPRALELAAAWRARLPSEGRGWAEAVGPGWLDAGRGERTMLCQSRLAYVFLHAGLLGDAEAARVGLEGLGRLEELFWDGRGRGWRSSIDREGRPLDPRLDCYDQAFGLLALAWAFRLTGEPPHRERAIEALEALDAGARRAGIEGYPEWREADGTVPDEALEGRRQNPHMHLFEAFLAWGEADPAGPWLERARAIRLLLATRFTATAEGGLAERLGRDLLPLPGREGRLREPGHHFEWVWLLRRWVELAGPDPEAETLAERLWTLGSGRGTDGDCRVFELLDAEEGLVSGAKLLWPQTERLKAFCARYELGPEPALAALAARCLQGFGAYFEGNDPLVWHNRLERERRPVREPALSRLLYHLFVALVDYERVFGAGGPRSAAGPLRAQGAAI